MSMRSATPPLDPVAGAAAFVLRIALAILLIGVPIASVATRQAVYAIVPIGAALTLIAWLLDPDMRGPRRLRGALTSPAGLGALFLFAWTALSLLWTPFAVGPTERFVKTAATVGLVGLAIAFLPERTKTSNLYLLPIGAMAGALAVTVASLAGWNPPVPPREFSVLDRAALGLTLLFWPGIAGLLIREKRKLAVALTGLTVLGVVVVGRPLAAVALALSAIVYGLARSTRAGEPRTAGGLAIGWSAVVLLAPVLAFVSAAAIPPEVLPAITDPTLIWGDIIRKDGGRTLIGHGFDAAARAVASGYLPFASPKSFLFEQWFEGGLVGACAAAFVVAQLHRLAGTAPGPIAPALLAGLTNALFVTGFGVGAAPIWWITFLALDALAFALVFRGQFRGRRPLASDLTGAPPVDRLRARRPKLPLV